jgi:anti-sigma factor ChrR (cupin superfamily)
MKLNADISQRAVVFSQELPWIASPTPKVHRRMLERDGDEIARATTIVRFDPDSYFPKHSHGGGEEFLVLEGVFSDEHGDHHPGSYVRNPVGSSHTPYSQAGCTIFVKLWQMPPDDQKYVFVNTNTAPWHPGLVPGQKVMSLHTYGTEQVALEKWEPDTYLPQNIHSGGEEIFVLDGAFSDEYGYYPQGTWLRNPPNSSHKPFTQQGCLIYIKTGHLKFD